MSNVSNFLRYILVFSICHVSTLGADDNSEMNAKNVTETRQYYGTGNYRPNKIPSFGTEYRCPLCDKSVYVYCGEKMLHDACCCSNPHLNDTPHQCKLADCRFLHANNCREHRLISNCCCSDDYRSLLNALTKV